jgi:hypothetical protein
VGVKGLITYDPNNKYESNAIGLVNNYSVVAGNLNGVNHYATASVLDV